MCLYVNHTCKCPVLSTVRVTYLHLKCTQTLFMSDVMERNPKTSKVTTWRGSGFSV